MTTATHASLRALACTRSPVLTAYMPLPYSKGYAAVRVNRQQKPATAKEAVAGPSI